MDWKDKISIILFEEICCKYESCYDCPLFDSEKLGCLRTIFNHEEGLI